MFLRLLEPRRRVRGRLCSRGDARRVAFAQLIESAQGGEQGRRCHLTLLEFLGRIPGAELAIIHGGGHCCQHTTPEPTNAALGEWLARKGF